MSPGSRPAEAARRALVSLAVAGLLLVPSVGLQTGSADARAVVSVTAVQAALNAAEVERFMDGFMADLSRRPLPGAAVSVVKEGRVLLEKGYGLSNLDDLTPMSDDTQLRVKSVSKTFAATAVMQLVEQSEVDLHTDVAEYLPGFEVPGGSESPITLHQLLTHTSGISDRGIGTMSRDREEAADLRGYLADRMPDRLYPPGSTYSYTDHGISLAGLVVEEVSGLPFAQYVRERILVPMGMDASAFDPPLEGDSDVAAGYQLVDGEFRAGPVGYFRVAPAVSLVTSAHDMGRFMLAMLEGGSAGDGTILRPETVELMQARHYAPHPDGTGVAYGFFEWPQNNQRVLVHGGSGHGYGSLLMLLPEKRVGLFVATNADESPLRGLLRRAFMDRFYPAEQVQFLLLPDSPPPASTVQRFAGAYREYRYDGGRMELLGEVFGQESVSVNQDGTLTFTWSDGRWIEYEDLLFRNMDDPEELVTFQTDDDGQVTRIFVPPDSTLVKVPWYGSMVGFLSVWVAFAFLFLSSAVVWVVALILGSGAEGSRSVRAVAGVVGLLNVSFLAGVPLLILPYAGLDGSELDFGLTLPFRVALAIPFVTAALGVVLAVGTLMLWRRRGPGRIYFTVVAAGALLFPAFLSYWKLFGLDG